MKIVKLKGGLGNQLFQYSYAYLLQKMSGDEVKIDLTPYRDTLNDPVRQPRILKMNISIKTATEDEVQSSCLFNHRGNMLTPQYRAKTILETLLNRNYFWEKDRSYIEPDLILKHKYFDGQWQSWRYIDPIWEELRNEFTPNYSLDRRTEDMIDKVSREESVFIGIRKGDYTAEVKHYGAFGIEYYHKAMEHIEQRISNPVYYIFSNDIPWVKRNMGFAGHNVIYREPEDIVDDFEDFFIMASCRHSIIINSSFHWWGARLNDCEKKIVVAPKTWFFDNKPIDIVPPNWIQI